MALSLLLEPRTHAVAPRRVLAAVDLGPTGETALRVAHEHVVDTRGRLAVCHVLDDRRDPQTAAHLRGELLAMISRVLGPRSDEVRVFAPLGDTAEMIDGCAKAWGAQLVVIGKPEHAHNLIGRLFKPDIVDRVVQGAPCSVLVAGRRPGTGRIVIGTDFSDPSMPVLAAAAEEQARTGASVHLVHCVAPQSLYAMSDPAAMMFTPAWPDVEDSVKRALLTRARQAGLRAAPIVMCSRPAPGLLELVDELDPDLVVVGTHHRRGLARLALGSVAEHVLHQAPCPVMVVHLQ